MNVPSLPPTINKRLSRSNSTSSSVATVKYIGSKIGHRSTRSTTRPTSSDSINHHFSILDAAAEQSNPKRGDDAARPSRSPNRNINRWSHSTSSSMGAVEKDVMRHVPPNSIAARAAKFESPAKPTVVPKSQYSVRQPNEPSLAGPSYRRSPGRHPRSPRKNSPEGLRVTGSTDRFSPPLTTSDMDPVITRNGSNDYFGTTVLDHSRGANKFGQPVEGIALQVTSGTPRQRRADQNKFGGGLHEATNSSHISVQKKPGHNRRRDRSANSSRDTANGNSVSSLRSDSSKKISHRSPRQKNMLSQALAKANQAVLLDNAQDIQGAIEAYIEACNILEEVMVQSADDEDRKKLSAIRSTYSSRIADLYDIDKSFEHLNTEKELPEAPATTHYLEGQDRMSFEDPEDYEPHIALGTENEPQRSLQLPLRQESLLPQIFGGEKYMEQQSPPLRQKVPPLGGLSVPMDAQYMPPPLSPRRPPSPTQISAEPAQPQSIQPNHAHYTGQQNRLSSGSTSWLDTLDDNNSSLHSSRLSSVDFGVEGNQLASAIEAEFDAMSAAVDAAYEEDLPPEPTPRRAEASFHQNHDLEQPSTEGLRSLATQPSQDSMASSISLEHSEGEYDEDDRDEEDDEEAAAAAEEEALLEMVMADGYKLDNQNDRMGAMSSLPRQSDSSGFSVRSSGRTWESSMTTATNGTTLSTLAESPEMPQHDPPEVPQETSEATLTQSNPEIPTTRQGSPPPALLATEKPGLRDRRLSGQSAKQLKIETFTRRPSVSQQGQPTQPPLLEVTSAQLPPSETTRPVPVTITSAGTLPATPLTSIHSAESIESPDTPGLSKVLSNSTIGDEPVYDPRIRPVRKNMSSSNLRPRNLSVTTNDLNEHPPTPGSGSFPPYSRQGNSILTPAISNASPSVLSSTVVGGMYIFDHIADPLSPNGMRSPESMRSEPLPLEPCPESFLLRPFWLMRCLYQTMAHPKGGYVSTKLFIPRDIWRVKGIKIKGIEDKIGQCDVLTAALLKLAKVDTLDATAVYEELSTFEVITDNTRVQLQKKLGGDVGITGSMAAMKASPAEDPEGSMSKTSSSMRSFTNSWKKLRSKSSTATSTPANLGTRRDAGNEAKMASLPMTGSSAVQLSRTYRNQRYPPPTPSDMPFIPTQHANYMSSLARLFDAVQVLDSIARQVEDPGLKGSSQSHVGLELSIRGAAEFFSFYVLRFVLADIGLLLDKYLKRNGEWVLS